ncbi:hypothetical protein KHS38_08370 [Mucilaginibacter sp. Bleaf8]|uniref:hypothetical protein n=1 Tax=Mucilaginibacter sp. Bleaf8 TaxID=2834430 RepID=UPI001BCB4BD8|nr:hypothetical protein [Mucilaginibacter sp. Bleaf8]MBS7564420.1 hypothetical protein [Mucilaginibacter sp. Bleaf8]
MNTTLLRLMFGLVVFMILSYVIIKNSDRQIAERETFVKSLHLKVTFTIEDMVRTNNHGAGIIYGRIIKSNKQKLNACFKNKYLFCKINKGKFVLVSQTTEDINVADTIVINSDLPNYTLRTSRGLIDSQPLYVRTDNSLSDLVNKDKAADIKRYLGE